MSNETQRAKNEGAADARFHELSTARAAELQDPGDSVTKRGWPNPAATSAPDNYEAHLSGCFELLETIRNGLELAAEAARVAAPGTRKRQTGPDWGDAGDVSMFHKGLAELHDRVWQLGEYAPENAAGYEAPDAPSGHGR